jgi:hypothetical protein
VLLRLPCLALTGVFTLIRLLPMSDSDKNVEILALRHQLAIPAAPDRQTPLHPARPGTPRRSPASATKTDAAATAPDRLPRHRPTLAPRPTPPPPRQDVPPETARPAAHRPRHQGLHPAPGEGKHELGLPTHPRRASRPGDQGRPVHSLGDPQRQRYRARAPSETARPGPLSSAARHTRSSPPISSRPEL